MKVLSKIRRSVLALSALAVLAFPAAAAADSNKFIEGNGPINKADPLAVAERFTYQEFETDPQTATKATAGTVHTVTVGTKGSSGSHVALWDASTWAVTAGTGAITGGTLIADIDTNAQAGTFTLDTDFTNGLVVTCLTGKVATNCAGTNTQAGKPIVTIAYR